jgi:hypothetical protein
LARSQIERHRRLAPVADLFVGLNRHELYPDHKIQKVAEAYALDACDFLRDHFRITLDWSAASIQQIESALDRFHREAAKTKPSLEQVMQFAKMFGSYIGEVYRKNPVAHWRLDETGNPATNAPAYDYVGGPAGTYQAGSSNGVQRRHRSATAGIARICIHQPCGHYHWPW